MLLRLEGFYQCLMGIWRVFIVQIASLPFVQILTLLASMSIVEQLKFL
ncbi:hypothetical protein APH_1222 [Anaplasma phagocytophilum str. HZ]|uniref:Uncharacterized protein n=1 Tax=Anaplasma phagocytophilum (strain HZ) TaxID=212042 RepID=Q2GIE8_ANAPZ|nr:hypothetical protein APH_1353 [Anaplasma phagocytophilum str. HZ]ABD44004.1 hypothetical protein APH_1222 [Anaplasma phagocytophilum str. HZ]